MTQGPPPTTQIYGCPSSRVLQSVDLGTLRSSRGPCLHRGPRWGFRLVINQVPPSPRPGPPYPRTIPSHRPTPVPPSHRPTRSTCWYRPSTATCRVSGHNNHSSYDLEYTGEYQQYTQQQYVQGVGGEVDV